MLKPKQVMLILAAPVIWLFVYGLGSALSTATQWSVLSASESVLRLLPETPMEKLKNQNKALVEENHTLKVGNLKLQTVIRAKEAEYNTLWNNWLGACSMSLDSPFCGKLETVNTDIGRSE